MIFPKVDTLSKLGGIEQGKEVAGEIIHQTVKEVKEIAPKRKNLSELLSDFKSLAFEQKSYEQYLILTNFAQFSNDILVKYFFIRMLSFFVGGIVAFSGAIYNTLSSGGLYIGIIPFKFLTVLIILLGSVFFLRAFIYFWHWKINKNQKYYTITDIFT